MTEYTRENMPEGLKLAAQYEWPKDAYFVAVYNGMEVDFVDDCDRPPMCDHEYSREEHAAARQALGLDQPEVTEAEEEAWREKEKQLKETSDGSTASYYQLPKGATELYHLIIHKNMNAQLGEIFRAAYRYGQSSHSDQLRDARKIKAYIEQEIERLENKCIG